MQAERNRAALPGWWQRHQAGDADARQSLIRHYGYLVPKTRFRVLPVCPPAIDPGDVEQEGRLALCRAVDHFEPGRGVRFITFALTLIRGAILEYLRREDWAPRSVRDAEKQVEAARDGCLFRGGPGGDREQAAAAGLPLDQFLRLRAQSEPWRCFSIYEPEYDGQEAGHGTPAGTRSYADQIADPRAETDREALTALQMRELAGALAALPEREAEVLYRHFWQGETLKGIARGLGVSESRVQQLAHRGRTRLRRSLEGRL